MIKIISVSGGKDSTCLYSWATRKWGHDGYLAVFADTGHEHPVTLNYVRNMPDMIGGAPIHWVKSNFTERLETRGLKSSGNTFLDLCMWKRLFPRPKMQFCTEHLKLHPIRDWVNSIRGDDEIEMFTGIRAGESKRRSCMPEQEWSNFYDCEMKRPLLRWSEKAVFNYLKRRGVPPNPLYALGFSRVGCFPCIHANKGELKKLPD